MPGYYNIGGEVYPSVTTILQKMLPEPNGIKFWKMKTPNWEEVLRERATIGTLVHYRILNGLAVRTLDVPNVDYCNLPTDLPHLLEITDTIWEKLDLDIGLPRVIETIHIDRKEKYVGTPDIVAPIDGIRTLGDIKTSKDIHDTHILQMGGYYNMLKNNNVEYLPERAYLISVHPFIKGNPKLEGHVVEIKKKELEEKAKEFAELARDYHRIFSVRRKGKVTRLLTYPGTEDEITTLE